MLLFLFLLFNSSARHPSAALPQASAVPPPWTSVRIKHTPPTAQPTPTWNPSQSAQFTPQVPSTVLPTPLQEFRAPLNAPFTQTKQTPRQTAPSTLWRITTAHSVLSTPQGRLQTAPCIQRGLTTVTAIKTVPCTGKAPSQNRPRTAHFTPQGFKSALVPRNQKPRRRRPKQGTVRRGEEEEETLAA